MFEDGRSKKVVFIAHCLLNQNAISDGTAVRPAAFEQLAYALLEREIGIVQMPCPELCCLGLDRGDEAGGQRDVLEENTRIRAEMQKPRAHGRLTALVEQVMWQIGEYHRHGFEILAQLRRGDDLGRERGDGWDGSVHGRAQPRHGGGRNIDTHDGAEGFGQPRGEAPVAVCGGWITRQGAGCAPAPCSV